MVSAAIGTMVNKELHVRSTVLLFILTGSILLATGCSKDATANKGSGPAKGQDAKSTEVAKDDHSGWWCAEHGIPEEECSMCSAKVAAECKKKGDWCDKHDRAKSQCFICDPKLKDQFAAKYRAKYGKEPPPIEGEEKKDSKDSKKG